MSYLFRKVKKYGINLLEVFAFSSYYTYISIILLVLTWFSLFGAATIYINSFIVTSWIIGWQYQIYKQDKRIRELEAINASLSYEGPFAFKQDLAALMHEIWAEDISKTELAYKDEYRTDHHYFDLSDDVKQVNLDKADRVLQLINSYKKNNNNV